MPALRRPLVAFAALALAFVGFSLMVGFGLTSGPDRTVARDLDRLWEPALKPLFQGVALLGGIELTTLLVAGLAVYLWRHGFESEIWALLAFPVSLVLEAVYKKFVHHPGPPFDHGDGPSLSGLLEKAISNSFPSGHMTRTVVVYGLLGFVVHRLAGPGRLRSLALPVAAVIIALMAFAPANLELTWPPDAIGRLLPGGAAATASA